MNASALFRVTSEYGHIFTLKENILDVSYSGHVENSGRRRLEVFAG